MLDSKLEYGLDCATQPTQATEPERAQRAGGVVSRILLSHPRPGKPASPTHPSMPRRRTARALKHSSLWVYRVCLYALVASVLLAATCMLGVRYWLLPNIDSYSPQISAAISQATRQRIVIGAIRGDWDGLRPRLQLQDVRLYDAQGRERMLLAAVDSTLSWASVLALEPLFHSIELTGLSFEVRRDASGGLLIAGIALDGGEATGGDAGLADWVLRQRRVILRDSEVTWVDETLGGTPVQLKQVQVEVQRLFRRNRFGLRAVPPLEVASPIDLRGDLDGRTVRDLREWKGQLYLQIGYADLAALRQWVPLPVHIDRGAGGMEVWVELQAGQVRAVTADVGLSGVRTRLRADLPALELERLQGRLAWQIRPEYLGFSAQALTFATPDGLELAPADVRYARTGLEGDPRALYEVQFDAVDVAAVTRLIDRVPVDETLRARLAALQPRGTVKDCRVSWRGSVRGDRRICAPGCVRASGGAQLRLRPWIRQDQRGAGGRSERRVAYPARRRFYGRDARVVRGPVAAGRLQRQGQLVDGGRSAAGAPGEPGVRQRAHGGSLRRHLCSAGAGPGTDRSHRRAGPPGRRRAVALRADERAPRRAPLAADRHRRRAVVDAQVTLRGDLQRFPFADGNSGVFEVVSGMRNGTLAYAPSRSRPGPR